jgi:hypothetical protein
MPRLSFKPDSSFFRKIVIGAVGARAVCDDLAQHGHQLVELERGSTNSKLWKDVKRKRVRIPDLVCVRCGTRVECRAKTEAGLTMSHSPTDAERAWDFGMVDADWIAFPVCQPAQEVDWTGGKLQGNQSCWRENRWLEWQVMRHVNYFTVQAFRSCLHARSRTKGVEEGSENFIGWDATFSSRDGPVLAVDADEGRVTIALSDGTRPYTWRAKPGARIFVSPGETVCQDQVIAATVPLLLVGDLTCRAKLPTDHIARLLSSRERTQRFTGIKLARLRKEPQFSRLAQDLANDGEEDVYVRLEAVSYLVACCERSIGLFESYLKSGDQQTQLEAVIALGETATPEAVVILSKLLKDSSQPFFLRSAAAWSLGQVGSDLASRQLVGAFADLDVSLRYEALDNLIAVGHPASAALVGGLEADDQRIVAGCAEALRQQPNLSKKAHQELVKIIQSDRSNQWAVWLIGHLPREQFNTAIAELQYKKPELHYAISLLWSFVESWIARRWQVNTSAAPPIEGCLG